ncbi:MAG TPA: prolyl oligopeptidase family serine peptidase [Gemmatimonadaceae bacterium]|nr:prolyl oligopeptidase family serine peptidase [Gemmatimonadaceae bacterium]
MRLRATLILASSLAFISTLGAQQLQYPESKKGDVVDQYQDVSVPDPYRWMENLGSAETVAWIKAQNAVSGSYLEKLPHREALRKRITELWDYPKVTLPFREAGRLFYRKNSGLQRQSVLFMRRSLNGPARVVLDPNKMFPDGSTALATYAPSPDGKLMMYAVSEGGADWQTLRVRDLTKLTDLRDNVRWVRFSAVEWTKDGKGFFYSRYPEPPQGKKLEAALTGHALYYHRIGTPQSQDQLIYQRKDLPGRLAIGDVSEDGRYLVIYVYRGADPRNMLYVKTLGDPMEPNIGAPVKPLSESDDAEYTYVGNAGTTFFIRTDKDAPNRKIISLDVRDPAPEQWRTIIPESKNAIEDQTMTGGRLAVHYLVDVQSEVKLFDLNGRETETIALPSVGSVAGLSGRFDSPELFYGFTSPLYPATVFRYDRLTKKSTPFEAASPKFDPAVYETKQLWATSKDGTRIPFFVTARKGLTLDGGNPTLLYGYGGFSITTAPSYRPDVPAWLELGGVYVTANMRGGGEYGEAWHKAGMLEKKQNVFDDFIAVAEALVRERYTSPQHLAIMGGSNGGLLVGAAMTQRPELFAVALPAVGVLDMLRYDKFTGGALWVSEYGSPTDSAAFRYLRAYSPLHNVRAGACYPATLITTSDHDDRVVPSHSYKFAATLQAAQGCEKPILLRVETMASHGYRPTDKRIAELADQWAFTATNTGMKTGEATP